MTTIDKICKNIGRLPLELRHAIFNCLTIDFRLEMLQAKKAQIIRSLFEAYTERLLNITALKRIVDKVIRCNFFYRKEHSSDYLIQPPLKKWLPPLEFKQMDEISSTEHPVFKALLKIVIIPKIHGTINSKTLRRWPSQHALDALTKIVSCITKTWDIIPTITVPSGCLHQKNHGNCGDNFNYRIRKYTFNSICTLTKFVSKFKVPLEERAVKKLKIAHMRYFKRSIIPKMRSMYRVMQRKLKLSAKKVAQETKLAAKVAKAAATKAKKDAKAAATKARKDAKAAATKARKDAKAADTKARKKNY
jgi:hypothetical protein